MLAHVAAFLGISALVIATPGQDTALTIRNTLLRGRRGGVLTALGVSSGQAVWALATAAGLAALVRASQPAFRALQLAGAVYLVWLGAQALWRALHGPDSGPADRGADPPMSGAAPFGQGLLSNLANPKMAVFFTSLLPQLVPTGGSAFPALLALGLLFSLLTLAWLCAYAVAVARAGDALRSARVRRWLDSVLGSVLVGLGVRLGLERS